MRLALTATCGLGATLVLAAFCAAAPPKGHAKPKVTKSTVVKPTAAVLAQGKALAAKDKCTGCHAPDLNGKKGFSPSLHTAGVLHEYTPKTWAVVMDTGKTNDGGMVKQPMPVYHMPVKDSTAIYYYLKTLK